MIRRDYILRMIAEFLEMLNRLEGLKKGQLWREASELIDEEFRKFIGPGAEAIAELSDTELLARVIQGEPTQVVRDKTLLVTALFKQAGDVAVASGKSEQSRTFYLKALHLLLDVAGQGDISDWPDFVPKIDMVVAALGSAPLPVTTVARLMHHYERAGEFAKAEDALYTIIETEPEHPGLREFGTAFYERLRRQTDDALAAGNLPRTEVEAGLREMNQSVAQ